ncbi:hypothetical protein LguiA_035976 [Lonicera macranthoides]
MIIDTTEVQAINSFSRLESLKEVYEIIWMLVPILTLVLGITIGVLVIVWLERERSAGIQQRIGPEYAGPWGILQALADGKKFVFKENLLPSRGDTRLFSIGPSIASFSSPRALPGKEEGVRPKGKGSPGTPNLTKTTKLVE